MEKNSVEAVFGALNQAGVRYLVAGGLAVGVPLTFVGLDDLLAMKRSAGRPQDLVDVERLEVLRRRR